MALGNPSKYRWLILLPDLVVLNGSYYLAYGLYFGFNFFEHGYISTFLFDSIVFCIYSFVWVFGFRQINLYKRHILLTRRHHLTSLFWGQIGGTIGYLLIMSMFYSHTKNGLFLLYFFVISLVLLSIIRVFTIRPITKTKWLSSIVQKRALIVGVGPAARILAVQFMNKQQFRIKLVGFISNNDDIVGQRIFDEFYCMGSVDRIKDIIQEYSINAVYFCTDTLEIAQLITILEEISSLSINIYINGNLLPIIPEHIITNEVLGYNMVIFEDRNKPMSYYIWEKTSDFFGSILLIVVFSPVLLLISVIIKATSRGPVLHKQIRVGKNEEQFEMYKFRSMYNHGESDLERKQLSVIAIKAGTTPRDGKTTKIVNHQRVTTIGKFIRKTSMDELPQLFNVLKGEMSLVGPRPSLPYEVAAYKTWHTKRFDVLPGCTGLWQITGRSQTGFDDMVILDLYYIYNRSPWLDVDIIIGTFPIMIKGIGGG